MQQALVFSVHDLDHLVAGIELLAAKDHLYPYPNDVREHV